jgi:hypothetical protein
MYDKGFGRISKEHHYELPNALFQEYVNWSTW